MNSSTFFFLLLLSAATADIPIHHSTTTSTSDHLHSLLNAASTDPTRLLYLSTSKLTATVPIASGPQQTQSSTYILKAHLGTPPQPLLLSLDTSSDSSFVSAPTFSPNTSSTYNPLDCTSPWCPQFKGQACPGACAFSATYGEAGGFSGTVGQDVLGLAADDVAGFVFGFVDGGVMKQGLLGLGRGSNGLMAQSDPLYHGVFSYCLPSFKSYYYSGSLRLGPAGQPKAIRTTPLLRNPHRSSLYYVNLTAVSVGRVTVPVPPGSFDFDPATGAGTIVDTGTVITRFVGPAYVAVRDEFRRQVNASGRYSSLGAFDTCFMDGPTVPKVTLHLSGLDIVLPMENTLIHSSASPLTCLAMAAAPNNVNAVVNVIANYQQQNYRVFIDTINSKVGFAREVCN